MLNFILGILFGWLVLGFIVLVEFVFIKYRGSPPLRRVLEKTVISARPKGSIIEAKSETEAAKEQILKENADKGLVTEASDLDDSWDNN